jgi:hypothetical protein
VATFGVTIEWSDEQLEQAGVDPAKLEKALKQFTKSAQTLHSMGLSLYAAAGLACFIHKSRPDHGPEGGITDTGSVVATAGQDWLDGGDW